MLLIIKSRRPDEPEKIPLQEKVRLILKQQIKEAKTDEDRKAAERELAKLGATLPRDE
ncbi:hypothetical protein [Bradyrhizobium sp. USDA 329]|uniref:hypothetical protein n=1 Tax=unclassified Bradyrhizobium TaxID=2631580 RepID=UPI003517A9C9